MKTKWSSLGGRSAAALCAVALFAARAAAAIPIDGYAATVNEQVIMVGDVIAAMQPLERQLRQTLRGDELGQRLEEAYTNTLNSLIERALIIDAFNRRKELSLPDAYVNARAEEIIRNRFNNNLAELNKTLQAEGLTQDEWKKNLRASIVVSLMREREVESKVAIAPQAVRDAYEREAEAYRVPELVELRLIMIHGGKTSEENALKRKLAVDICRRLLNGERFDALARQVSEGPKASEGGYVGWVDPASRRSELAEAIEHMDPGEISDIIAVADGFFILKIEGRRQASVVPFEKVRDEIREKLRKQEVQRLFDAWIARLKKEAFIKNF